MFGEFGSRDYLSGVMHEVGENTELMTGEFDGDSGEGDTGGAGIEDKRPAAQLRMGDATGAPDEGSNAGQNFLDAEGFGDIIVSAAVDALDLLVPTAAGGEDEDGSEDTGFAPAAEQGEPIDFRQTEIEDNGVVLGRKGEEIRLLAVEGAIYCIAGVRDGFRQLVGDERFVFDNEDPQRNIYSVV